MSAVAADSMDVDAFRAWVAPHLVTMRQLAARLTSVPDSDRVVHAALVRGWRDWPECDATAGSAQGWLLAIVADRCRRHRPLQRAPSELVDLPAAATAGARWMDLDAALTSLPWEPRLAMELFYLLGLDVSVCASVLGCNDDAVIATVAAARRRLLDGVEEIELS